MFDCMYYYTKLLIIALLKPLPANTQHSQQTHNHAPVGFEPTISTDDRQLTYALDRSATETGVYTSCANKFTTLRHVLKIWYIIFVIVCYMGWACGAYG